MTNEELEVLKEIASSILLLCSKAKIEDENFKRRSALERAKFSLYSLPPADAGNDVVLQFNNTDKAWNDSKNTLKEEKELKLKYGQGCISLKQRLRKDGTYYKIYEGRYYNEYGQVKSVYAKNKIDCYKKLKKAREGNSRLINRNKFEYVKDWVLEWYNTFKKNNVRSSTRRCYEMIINNYIISGLGKIKLIALNGEILQRFFNGIEAGNTRHKTFVLLNACLEKAVVLKKINFNECKAVELPKYKKKKRRPFTYAEQALILECGNPVLRQIFYFLCCTGLRIGEFLALTKEDFFFEEHFFKVDKSKTKEGNTKTDASERIIYFTDELINNFDFNILGHYNYAGLRIAFDRMLKSLNITNVSLHCTRHTFATICHSLGMNDKSLQALLGHSTLAMTQDVYTHLLKKGNSKIRSYLETFCTFVSTTI